MARSLKPSTLLLGRWQKKTVENVVYAKETLNPKPWGWVLLSLWFLIVAHTTARHRHLILSVSHTD